jgi:hypothetical protein
MSRPLKCIRVSLVAVAIGLATSPAAADPTKAQCATANASGQDLRRDGKLTEAREQLRMCSDPKCPAVVRVDCAKRLDELEGAQPTIVFDAKDGAGADITVVKVSVDNRPLAEKLDGSALPIEPGEHSFTFEVAGQTPVTQHIVVKEGEKGRHEKIVIGAPPPAPPPPPPPPPPAEGLGTQRILGIVGGGVGVAGIAVGSVFGLLTASAISKQKSDCASSTNCANAAQAASDHSTWTTDGTISTIAFIAGGALLAGGAIVFFTAGHAGTEQPAATGLMLVPSAGPGGGGMLLKGEF